MFSTSSECNTEDYLREDVKVEGVFNENNINWSVLTQGIDENTNKSFQVSINSAWIVNDSANRN